MEHTILPQIDNHTNYNCIVTLRDDTQYKIFGNWLHNHDLDQWQGWHCEAGKTRFYIDKNFDVWDGMCKNQKLGNALVEWHPNPQTICQRIRCVGCTDDLVTKKHAPTL